MRNHLLWQKFRDPVSGLTHLSGAILAAVGLVVLIMTSRGDLGKLAVLLIYGIALILMFASSAAYHLVIAQPGVIQFLRKLDHSAIYLLIAGTYTPICFYFLEGAWRWGMLGTVWALAVIGITVKLFIIHAPRWLTAGVYLVMGWLCVAGIQQMLARVPVGAIIWLLVGGILFTLGAVIYITKKPDFIPDVFGFHEVWHVFVLLGAFSHFFAILFYVAL